MGDFGQHLMLEKLSKETLPLGGTGWAETPALTAEGKKVFSVAFVTADSHKAVVRNATLLKLPHHRADPSSKFAVIRSKEFVVLSGEGIPVVTQQAKQGRFSGLAFSIAGRHTAHCRLQAIKSAYF